MRNKTLRQSIFTSVISVTIPALLITAILLINAINHITGKITTPVEIERIEREFALRRAEDERAAMGKLNLLKTEFVGNISHELKTPLTVMSCCAQECAAALRRGEDTENCVKNMKIITAEADRLALMVSQLLDISRIDEGKMNMTMRNAETAMLAQDALNTYYPLPDTARQQYNIQPDWYARSGIVRSR